LRGGILLFCALVCAGCAGVPADRTQGGIPKNIIIMFADGAAPTQWEVGKYAARHLRNAPYATTDVVFREGAVGLLSTHAHNAFVTDSAAAATAMSTGTKVNNYMVSIDPDGTPLRTFMEMAKAAGKKIGLVTTAEIYDASPAGFSARAKRGEDQAIVDQYLELEPDVLIGGGRNYFLPKGAPGGKRSDDRDIVAAFSQKGYQIVRMPQELTSATGPRLLALFADESMAFEIDRDPATQPSFTEITQAALRVIARDAPNGFVLFVENQKIDTAGHDNDIAAMMRELWTFDEGVKVALDFQRRTPAETLMIVTADHETGGLSPTYLQKTPGSVSRSDRIFVGPAQFEMVSHIKSSLASAVKTLGKKPTGDALDAVIAERFPGFKLDTDLREAILADRPIERSYTYNPHNTLGRMIARQTGFYWATSGHTTEPVLVGAMGPGAELFRGYQDNTDFGKHLHELINAP
jgi:alkaline phosphatase